MGVLRPVIEGSAVTLASLNMNTLEAQMEEASREAGQRGLVSAISFFVFLVCFCCWLV